MIESSGVEPMQPVEKLEKEKDGELSSESITSNRDLNKEMKNIKSSGLNECEGMVALQRSPSNKQRNSTSEEDCISSKHLTGDAKDLATSSTSVLISMTESPNPSSSTKDDEGNLDHRNAYQLDQIDSTSLGTSSFVPSTRALSSDEEIIISVQPDIRETDSSLSNTDRVGNFGDGSPSERTDLVPHGVEGNIGNRVNEPSLFDELSDLSGDYDMHLNNLNYAVWCHEVISKSKSTPSYESLSYPYYGRGTMDVLTHGRMFTGPPSTTPFFSPASYYLMNQPLISGSYNTEDVPKCRGTGTFFPNVNYQLYEEQHSPGRVNNAVSPNRLLRSQNNLEADTPQGTSSVEKGSHEPAIQNNLQVDIPQSSSQHAFKTPNAGERASPLEYGKVQFGSLSPVSVEAPAKMHGSQNSGFTSPSSSSLRPAVNSDMGRCRKSQSYQMKDEDFPPLSG